jgi:hypothetical protein
MKTLDQVIKDNSFGMVYGNRILLPFVADILKAVIEDDIIMDFSSSTSSAYYTKHKAFTEIYFYDYKNLTDVVSEYETIKLIVVEEGKDLFDFSNHKKIVLHISGSHKLTIEEINDDTLFVE